MTRDNTERIYISVTKKEKERLREIAWRMARNSKWAPIVMTNCRNGRPNLCAAVHALVKEGIAASGLALKGER